MLEYTSCNLTVTGMLIKQEHRDLWLYHVPTGADITPHASDKLTFQQTPWTGEVSV